MKRDNQLIKRWGPRTATANTFSDATACARFLAAWELGYQQGKKPNTWRRLHYENAAQIRSDKGGREPWIVWYGVGPPKWTAARIKDLAEYLGEEVRAQERIACGHAYAVISAGLFSPGCIQRLERPPWITVRRSLIQE